MIQELITFVSIIVHKHQKALYLRVAKKLLNEKHLSFFESKTLFESRGACYEDRCELFIGKWHISAPQYSRIRSVII